MSERIEIVIETNYGDRTVEATLLPDIAPHLAHCATFAIHRTPFFARGSNESETGEKK